MDRRTARRRTTGYASARNLIEVAAWRDGGGLDSEASELDRKPPQIRSARARHLGRWLCLGGGCSCPSGQKQLKDIPDHVDVPAGSPVYAGLAAGDAGPSIVVDGHAMDEFCDAGRLGGTWFGSCASTRYPIHGGFQMQLAQTPDGFEGQISITGSGCVSGGRVTGTVTSKRVTFGVVQSAGKAVSYTGTLTGSRMAGAFASPSCGGDEGNWRAKKG